MMPTDAIPVALAATLPPAALSPAALPPGPFAPVLAELQTGAHVFIAVVTLGALAYILLLVRQRRLRSKYALLWLTVGLVLGVLAVFPDLLKIASDRVGVYDPPNLFLVVACAFLFLVVVQFSWELSRMEERTRVLAEEIALLRARPAPTADTPPEPSPTPTPTP